MGTMPEKMDADFDPMAVATSLHRQYRETQLDPAQSIQEILKTIDALKGLDVRPGWQNRVAALEAAVETLKNAIVPQAKKQTKKGR